MENNQENTFSSLGIDEQLVLGLKKQGILLPTLIQQEIMPLIVTGVDVIGRAKTGSGKTLAYLLPIFMRIDENIRGVQAIILTPTHELASQVHRQVELLSSSSKMNISSALIIGGANMERQLEKLKEKPQIVVGSYGRILDLIKRKKLSAHTVKTIVLDEADRLLDERNFDGVEAVIKTTLRDRQLILVSASISEETKKQASKIMKEDFFDRFAEEGVLLPKGITHYYILADIREKMKVLRKILATKEVKKTIVFLNNIENIEVTVERLIYHGLHAVSIYGIAGKLERKNAMADFMEGRVNILVASDIGARGLDIEGITHIINLDIPEEPVNYLHRAGRTGRKDELGTVISIVTPYEQKWIRKYEKAWNIVVEQKEMSFGALADGNKTKKDLDWKTRKEEKAIINDIKTKKEERKEEKKEIIKNKVKEKKIANTYSDKKKVEKQENDEGLGFFAKKAKKQAEKLAKKQK